MAPRSKVTKADLIKQAEKLGVSTEGTKDEIAARLAQQPGRTEGCEDCGFRSRRAGTLAAHRRWAHPRKENG